MVVIETEFKNNVRIRTRIIHEDFLPIPEILERCMGGPAIGVVPITYVNETCSCVVYRFMSDKENAFVLHYIILKN